MTTPARTAGKPKPCLVNPGMSGAESVHGDRPEAEPSHGDGDRVPDHVVLAASRPKFLHLVLFAAAFLAGSWLGRWLELVSGSGVSLWPPSGLYLAVLLLSERRHWPWWILAGLPAGIAGCYLWFHSMLPAALVLYLGNTLEALAGATLARRWCGTPFRLNGLCEVLALVGCGAVLGPALGATLGAATLDVLGHRAFATAWPLWWVGNAAGVLMVAPLVLAATESRWRKWREIPLARWAEFGAMLAAFIVVSHLIFSGRFPFAFIVTLPLLWAALRFEIPGAALTTFILAVLALRYTAAGQGRFASPDDPEEWQWLLQLFLFAMALSALVVAALTRQRRHALLGLRSAYDELEARVVERTARLQESENRLRFVVESSPDHIFIQDGDLRYVWSSRPTHPMTQDEPAGRTSTELVLPEDADRLTEIKHRTLMEGQRATLTIKGQHRVVETTYEPWRDAAGSIIGLAGYVRDITERHRAEEALRQRAEEIERLLDVVPAAVFVASDPDCLTITGNRRANELYEASPGENVSPDASLDIRRFYTPGGRELTADELPMQVAIAANRAVRDVELDVRLPSGRILSLLGNAVPLRNERGEVRGCIGAFTDITERKRIEQSLAESEEKHRTLLGSLQDGVFVALDHRFVFANPALPDLLGYTDEEFLDLPFEAVVAPESLPLWTERFIQRTSDGPEPPWRYEARLLRKNGEALWAELSARRIHYGGRMAVLGIIRNITEQKRAEAALRESEKRLSLALESGQMGLWEWDIRLNRSVWNAKEYELLGLPVGGGQEPTETFFRLVHPDDAPAFERSLAAVMQEGSDWRDECRIIRPDGEVRWLAAAGRLFRDPEGQPRLMIGVNYDITERKRVEEALREADQRKNEFLAMLAHELRNPLAPILNGLYLLRKLGDPSPDAEPLLAMMERQLNHLIRLVDDLLEVSRISRGKIELRKERTNLADVIGHAVETCQPLIQAGRHALTLTLPPAPLPVDADPVRLAQVLANLLNNAAKYMEPGGAIHITAEQRDHEAVVSVRDQGMGISAEMLPYVFNLFTQVDRSLHRSQGGLGIGLALVHRLVEMHGGRVEAHSEGPGRGSEFIVRLPLADASPAEPPAPEAPPEAVRFPHRILVVDDNRDAADSLTLLLLFKLPDTQVRVAYDGPTALDLLTSFQPEVVFLDLGMPGMDGFETARHIRQRPEGRDVTLIALTGWGQNEDRRRTREAGFDHHLVKPVDFERLRTLLAIPEGGHGKN